MSRIIIILSIFSLISCSAVNTAVTKRKLAVETKMSSTIFLDPVADSKKTIYLQIRNTSDKSLELKQMLKEDLENKGYKIVNSVNKANFVLQVNVLQAGKNDPNAATQMLMGGFGKTIDLAALSTLGALAGSRHNTGYAVGGGLLGAGLSIASNALVKDVYYSVITDLKVTQNKQKNTTRILSSANKVNLKWNTAKTELESGLVKSISGLF